MALKGRAELATLLKVSPAAISGTVRYLSQVNLLSRESELGSRRDLYRVHDDHRRRISLPLGAECSAPL